MFDHQFYFTRHAVDRFIERVRPSATTRMALSELQSAAAQALPTDRRTRGGQRVWLVKKPPMRLITKPEDGRVIVVTVVEGHDGGEDEAVDEVLEAYRRLQVEPANEELVTPAPRRELAEYRTWLHVEEQRIGVERARIKALNLRTAADERMAKQMNEAAQASARARAQAEKTERHRINETRLDEKKVRWRNALLREAAGRLRDVDPDGSAELLQRIEATIARDEYSPSDAGAVAAE